MADSQLSKKPVSPKSFSGSLTRRVFLISLFLLIIPLFFQSLFLYRQEYETKLEDVKQILDWIGKEREAAIEQLIQMDWNILDFVGGDIDKHRKEFQIERVNLPQGVGDKFAISSVRRGALLVGKKETSNYALVIPVPFDELIANLQNEHFPYPIRMALIDDQGKLLAENMKVRASSNLLVVKEDVPSADFNLIITIPEDLIEGLHKTDYYYRLAILVFFVGIVGGFGVWWLTSRMAKPLNHLRKSLQRVSEGAVHVRYTPDKMGFEINDLGKQVNETLDSVLQLTQEAEKERTERQKLAEEWRIGHDIQAGLFPKNLPGFKGLEAAAGYIPAKEVNGDFYDLFVLENGKLLIAMADTAGKGISACLFSLGIRSSIRSLATTTDDLAEIVLKANDLFWADAHESSTFTSLWLGIYDPKKKMLAYCTQGHPPALLRRDKEIIELWTGGISLGAQKFDSIPTKEIRLESKDTLLFYTDGIIEAHNLDNELFGKERLNDFFAAHKKETPQQCVNRLLKEVAKFSEGASQHDDMTLLLIHVD